jgi:hypothetical protein
VIVALENTRGERLDIEDGLLAPPHGAPDLLLRVGEADFHPGLINAHDHLYRNHYPRLGSPPYEDAYAWGLDIQQRCRMEIERSEQIARHDAVLFGAFKNIIGGVTTVVHHDPWHEVMSDADFPVRVVRVGVLHSLGFERAITAAARALDAGLLRCMHVAEGTNARAFAEVAELARLGLLDERLLAVHLVGVDEAAVARLRDTGAAAVWCPSSNCFLFGRTAPRALFDGGIDALLGTDSLLTGAGTMLDELRAARVHGYLDDARLLGAVGTTAARRLGLAAPLLEDGANADVIVLRAPLLDARAADVALVLVRGRPVLADEDFAELFAASGVTAQPIVVGGVRKLVVAPLGEIAARVFDVVPECARIAA